MRGVLFASIVIIAGCIDPSGTPGQNIEPGDQGVVEPEQPGPPLAIMAHNMTNQAVLRGCTGVDTDVPGTQFNIPWHIPGWNRSVAVVIPAFFYSFRCTEADLFGQATFKNLTFAIEGHGNISDNAGHIKHWYDGLIFSLGFHVTDPAAAAVFAAAGWPAQVSEIQVVDGGVRLRNATGTIDSVFGSMDDPTIDGTDYGGNGRYVFLIDAAQPRWVRADIDRYVGDLYWAPTLRASGGTALAEWDFLTGPVPPPARGGFYRNCTITFTVEGA